MIKSKKCKLCDKSAFSKGFCQQHSPKKELRNFGKIKNSRIKTAEKKKGVSELREVYFNYHISRCTHSEFSGKSISEPTRSNICHLIDKGRHPSLEDNLDNYIYLTFQEHERFDKLLFSLEFDKLEKEFEKIIDLICIRYRKLLYLCKESTNFTRELKKYLDGRE